MNSQPIRSTLTNSNPANAAASNNPRPVVKHPHRSPLWTTVSHLFKSTVCHLSHLITNSRFTKSPWILKPRSLSFARNSCSTRAAIATGPRTGLLDERLGATSGFQSLNASRVQPSQSNTSRASNAQRPSTFAGRLTRWTLWPRLRRRYRCEYARPESQATSS